jgi:hypothetical protein
MSPTCGPTPTTDSVDLTIFEAPPTRTVWGAFRLWMTEFGRHPGVGVATLRAPSHHRPPVARLGRFLSDSGDRLPDRFVRGGTRLAEAQRWPGSRIDYTEERDRLEVRSARWIGPARHVAVLSPLGGEPESLDSYKVCRIGWDVRAAQDNSRGTTRQTLPHLRVPNRPKRLPTDWSDL